jgi:aminoglycoside 6-adenylyltransferase
MAKFRDWDLKLQLLCMIEWDHKARYGWDYDTWHRGAHMRAWMDPEIIAAVSHCWASLRADEMRPALAASVGLFDRLVGSTASRLGIAHFDSRAVRKEIDRLLASSAAKRSGGPHRDDLAQDGSANIM